MAVASLYIYRPVLNAEEILQWFRAQGFELLTVPADLHVTVAYSKRPVEWNRIGLQLNILELSGQGGRSMKSFGGGKATVMCLEPAEALVGRWKECMYLGCSWDHPGYDPHITISWKPHELDLNRIEPWGGNIILGPEIANEVVEDWRPVEKARRGSYDLAIF